MGKHSILGASSSHRWLNCTPSARLEAAYPEETSSFAAEGTLAHSLAELELRKKFKGLDLKAYLLELKQIQADPLYTSEMPGHVACYVALVEQEYNRLMAEDSEVNIYVEYKVDFSHIAPGGFGTADCVLCSPSEYVVIDLKYGMGVPVSAYDNPQLRLYALGVISEQALAWGHNKVSCIICQPRLTSISEATYEYGELIEWGQAVKLLARAAYEGSGELRMGYWCKFCKHKRNCQKQMEEAFAVIDAPIPKDLSAEDLAKILDKKDMITDYLKSIEIWALERVRDKGEHIPGYKLVEGRTMRKYADQDKAAEALLASGFGSEIYKKPELLGIGDMEKLVTKAKFKELLGGLIIKPEGAPTLAPENDKRPEIKTSAEDAFKNIEVN